MSTFIKSVTVQYFHSYGQKRNRREKMKKIGIIGAMELEVEERVFDSYHCIKLHAKSLEAA